MKELQKFLNATVHGTISDAEVRLLDGWKGEKTRGSRNVRWNSDGSPVTPWSEERHRDEDAVTVVSPFPSLVPWTTGTFSNAKEFVFRRTASEVLPSLKRHRNDLSFLLLLRLFLFQNSDDIVGTFPPTGYCSNICLLSDRAFYPNKGTRRKKEILGIRGRFKNAL